MHLKNVLKIIYALTLLTTLPVMATTDDESIIPIENTRFKSRLTPEEIFARTSSVLNYYDIPNPPSSQPELSYWENSQSFSAIQKLLPFMDPDNNFSRLFSLSESSLSGFDDIDGKKEMDFSVKLSTAPLLNSSQGTKILRGLKVSIDPGHMGETFWDKATGKYVKDGNGGYLSEGVIALQTALLLKDELSQLGAEVHLTRAGLEPVTHYTYDNLPIEPYAKNELQESIHAPWFQKLLTLGTGEKLFKAFEQSSEVKKLFSNSSKSNYFILREDLWARSSKINEFKPDIALVIHYDVLPSADGSGLNSNAPNSTKIYIAGGFRTGEFASRKVRKQFAKKLLDQNQWDQSIKLSTNILNEFKSQMNLNIAKSAVGGIPVAPGVFSRNLGLSRSIDAPALAYLEVLFYNRPDEFYAFLNTKHPMMINGKNYPYSDRLKQVVNSIKTGVINYAQSLDNSL